MHYNFRSDGATSMYFSMTIQLFKLDTSVYGVFNALLAEFPASFLASTPIGMEGGG